MQAEDAYWRADGEPSALPYGGADRGSGGYPDPPAMTPPPAEWRPPMVVEPPPPRRLPPQDHLALDRDEASARVFTRGVGLVVAAVLVIFSCLLCGQRLF